MTWAELLPLITQGGVFGAVAWIAYLMHRDAIQSQRERADDWREAARLAQARADERERQLSRILGVVTEKTERAGEPS